ncbi:MAG: major facilitator superfamily domain-containing protein [Podila humilis]|nr:MAG: major facilitator superfamily domain-containing protein [Podila humilis]
MILTCQPPFFLIVGSAFAFHFRLCLVLFMASLDQTIVSVLIPTMGKVFNAPQLISWVGTAYLLTNTAVQPLYGKLSDIFGRKNTMMAAIFFFLTGSLICGAAPTITVLIIGRGVAGMGAGGMISLTMIIISDVVSMRDRGKYQGIIGSMFGISAIAGPLLGGVLAEKSSWRWAFYLNLPLGAVSTIAIWFILQLPKVEGSNREKLKRIDFLGAFTIIVGIICVLLSTNWGGNEYAWNSVQVIVPYCVGAVFLLAFLYIEYKVAKEPIMPFRLFKIRTVCATYATSFFIGAAFMGAIFYCPLYFQMVMHESATKAGLQLLPMVAGMLLGGVGNGILISRTGTYRPFIWCAIAIYIVGMALLSLWDENSKLNVQIGFLIVVGVGLGGSMQSVVLAGQCAVPPRDIAVVTSMLSFFRTMGGVVSVAIGGSLINNVLSNEGIDPNNFHVVYSHPEKYALATQTVFRQCIAWPSLALVASFFMQHHELRKTVGARKEVTEEKLEQVKVAPTNEEDPFSLALTDVK